jgi:hypothetical protein
MILNLQIENLDILSFFGSATVLASQAIFGSTSNPDEEVNGT